MSSNVSTKTCGTEDSTGYSTAHTAQPPASKSQGLSILLAMAAEARAGRFQQKLTDMGHAVVRVARSGQEACQFCQELKPDLALLDIDLPCMDGLQAAYVIRRNQGPPVLLMTDRIEPGLKHEAIKAGIYACLPKRADNRLLAQTMEIARRQYELMQFMEEQTEDLRQEIKTRKLMGRASGILMEQLNIDHDQAVQRLHEEAQAKNQALMEVAQGVIIAEILAKRKPI